MKKLLCLILITTLCLGLTACGTKYEDTNGADVYTLQTITDEDIIHLKTGSSGLAYKESTIANVIKSTEYSSKNFNGVEELYTTNYILPSTVGVRVDYINVKSGNFRLVAINNDEIIHDFPLDCFSEEFYFENIKGTFSIHAVGESASVEFNFEVY